MSRARSERGLHASSSSGHCDLACTGWSRWSRPQVSQQNSQRRLCTDFLCTGFFRKHNKQLQLCDFIEDSVELKIRQGIAQAAQSTKVPAIRFGHVTAREANFSSSLGCNGSSLNNGSVASFKHAWLSQTMQLQVLHLINDFVDLKCRQGITRVSLPIAGLLACQ